MHLTPLGSDFDSDIVKCQFLFVYLDTGCSGIYDLKVIKVINTDLQKTVYSYYCVACVICIGNIINYA